jgi:hypothetical protein
LSERCDPIVLKADIAFRMALAAALIDKQILAGYSPKL